MLAAALPLVAFANARLNEGAFREQELEIQLTLLLEEEQALAGALQIAEAPTAIERRARELGLVPAESPVFLDLEDGRIVGEPRPAKAPPRTVDPGPAEVTAPRVFIPGAAAALPPTSAHEKRQFTAARPIPDAAASEAESSAEAATTARTR